MVRPPQGSPTSHAATGSASGSGEAPVPRTCVVPPPATSETGSSGQLQNITLPGSQKLQLFTSEFEDSKFSCYMFQNSNSKSSSN